MICGKIIYISRTEANNALQGMNSSWNKGGYGKTQRMPKVSYFCSDCNGWHVSSGSKSKVRRRNKSLSEEIVKPVKKVPKDVMFLRIVNFNK